MAVIEERKKKGIDDEIGPDASPIKEDGNKYERGKRNLETLTGRKEIGPKTGFAAFSPEMEGVPGSHLFSHVSRDDLLRNHHVVNVIVIGVSTHPARPLFMSDLRRIYPNVLYFFSDSKLLEPLNTEQCTPAARGNAFVVNSY